MLKMSPSKNPEAEKNYNVTLKIKLYTFTQTLENFTKKTIPKIRSTKHRKRDRKKRFGLQ